MRYTTYWTDVNGAAAELFFTLENYKAAGLRYMSTGMPKLEALELINEWNRKSQGRYTYWLGEGQ